MTQYANTLYGEGLGSLDTHGYAVVMSVGANIRRIRNRLGRSLTTVERATGIDRSKLSAIESGRAPNPTLKTLTRIAEDGLGVDIAELFIDEQRASELHRAELRDTLNEWLLDPASQELAITVGEIADALEQDQSFDCHETTNETGCGKPEHCYGAMKVLLAQGNPPNQIMRVMERLGMLDLDEVEAEGTPCFDDLESI